MNKPEPVNGTPCVVTVTSREPTVAPASMVIFAVKLVALLNVTELTVTPAPKLTDELAEKLVFDPVMLTGIVCPCRPLAGDTCVI